MSSISFAPGSKYRSLTYGLPYGLVTSKHNRPMKRINFLVSRESLELLLPNLVNHLTVAQPQFRSQRGTGSDCGLQVSRHAWPRRERIHHTEQAHDVSSSDTVFHFFSLRLNEVSSECLEHDPVSSKPHKCWKFAVFEHPGPYSFRGPSGHVEKEKEPLGGAYADSTESVNKPGHATRPITLHEKFVPQILIGFRERVICLVYRTEVVAECTSSDPLWKM